MSDIFKRYEIKYKVNNDIKEKLIKDLEDILHLCQKLGDLQIG